MPNAAGHAWALPPVSNVCKALLHAGTFRFYTMPAGVSQTVRRSVTILSRAQDTPTCSSQGFEPPDMPRQTFRRPSSGLFPPPNMLWQTFRTKIGGLAGRGHLQNVAFAEFCGKRA